MLLCNIIGVFWGLHTTSISGANDTALYTIVSIWNVSIFRLHWVLVIRLLHEYIQPELVNGAVLGGGCSCFYQCNKHNSCYVLYVWYICSGFPAPRARFYAHLPPSSQYAHQPPQLCPCICCLVAVFGGGSHLCSGYNRISILGLIPLLFTLHQHLYEAESFVCV